jgi:hypothetical protein
VPDEMSSAPTGKEQVSQIYTLEQGCVSGSASFLKLDPDPHLSE